jgi:hypothetical protein
MNNKITIINGLKAYMGYSRVGGSREGACLVFAHNTKEARKLTYPVLRSWFDYNGSDDWIDTATTVLKDSEFLFKEANQEKLAASIAHVIESPKTCIVCEMWGNEIDEQGRCDGCIEDIEMGE